MPSTTTVTERELRDAYKRAGLWRIGISFERAISAQHMRTALTCSANAARRHAGPAGHRTPSQLCLI